MVVPKKRKVDIINELQGQSRADSTPFAPLVNPAELGITQAKNIPSARELADLRENNRIKQQVDIFQTEDIFRNESGTPSGVTLPSGKTFLGLKPSTIRKMIEADRNRQLLDLAPMGGAGSKPLTIEEKEGRIKATIAELEELGALNQQQEGAELGTDFPTNPPVFWEIATTLENRKLLNMGFSAKQVQEFNDVFSNLLQTDSAAAARYKQEFINSEVRLGTKGLGDKMASEMSFIMESIPGFRGIARTYGGGFLNLDSAKGDEIVKNIKVYKESFSALNTAASQDPRGVLAELERAENDINELESRFQILTLISPELASHPEELDRIQDEIRFVRNELTNTRDKAAKVILMGEAELDEGTASLVFQQYKNKK